MGKSNGTLTAQQTGTSSIGTLRNFNITKTANVEYSRDADGEPDGDNGGVREPETFTAQLEIDGDVPDVKDTITVGDTVYILTSVSPAYEAGKFAVVDLEGTEQISGS